MSVSLSERSDKCLGLGVVCGSEGFRHWHAPHAGQELGHVELRGKPVSFALGSEPEFFLQHSLVNVEGFTDSYPRSVGKCLRRNHGSYA